MAFLPQLAGRIRAWKDSGYELFVVYFKISGKLEPFVLRALTKHEYESLVEGLDVGSYFPPEDNSLESWPPEYLKTYGTLQYSDILRAGLLYPNLDPSWPAGIDAQIAKQICLISGWGSKTSFLQKLNAARAKASTIWGFLESRIRTAFPHMVDSDIQKMTLESFVDKAAMSELITGVTIDPEPWVDPARYMAKVERAERINRRRRQESMPDVSSVRDPRLRRELEKQRLAATAEDLKNDLVNRLSDRDTKPDFERDNEALNRI